MQVTQRDIQDVVVFRVQGRLDAANSGALEAALLPTITVETRKVVFDFREVEYVSSGGLRVILLMAKQMHARQGATAIFGATRPVEGVFRISGLSRIVPLFADEAQAIAALDR